MAESMFDASNVGVAKGRAGGYSLIAPAGTDPTKFEDMTKTLAELIESVEGAASGGYIDEDGVNQSVDVSSDDHKDWATTTIGSTISEYTETVEVNFIESRESVLKAVFGDANVYKNEQGATVIRHNQNFSGEHLYVFDAVISDTKVKRSIIPRGVINERDSISHNSSDLLGYKPTIKCLAETEHYEGDGMREFLYDTTTGTVTQVTGSTTKAASSK